MSEQWNLIIIFAYVVVCSGLAIFLFSKPGWLWEMLDWDKKKKQTSKPVTPRRPILNKVVDGSVSR